MFWLIGVYVAADGTLLKGPVVEIGAPRPDGNGGIRGVNCGIVKPENDTAIRAPVADWVRPAADIGTGWELDTGGTCSGKEGLGAGIVGGANMPAIDEGGIDNGTVVICKPIGWDTVEGVDRLAIWSPNLCSKLV